MERRDEDWINPPEPKEDYEPDWDSINDEIWLRKKEAEENDDNDNDDEREIEVELEDDE